ncbi:MAG: hypothetical protein A3E01_08860 [Gammaproteobacteria bacterium RIFCSPHIGHO2_12_FULL_63_22]|nr:MAG: hypothetical protein A3E01_08860 [Gammaproteobacteria bacterium RIFCSPHIGHO2_12_FULL_63_22]
MGIAYSADGAAATTPPVNLVPRLLLILILAISAFIQFTVVSKTIVDDPLRADAGEYFSYAYNLHHYETFSLARTWVGAPPENAPAPDSIRSPGYPLFLLMAGTPRPIAMYGLRVTYLQAALGVLSVWMIYLIAVPLLGQGLALLAALLTATAPQLATISTYLLTESLFLFLLIASVLSLITALRTERRAFFVVTGLLWGLCSLVRPTAEFFPVLGLLAVLLVPRLRGYRANALLGFACFVAVLSPWLIRNQVSELRNPGSSLMVNTLAHGSYPGFMYEGRPETFAFPYRFDPNLPEITKDVPSVLKDIGRRFTEQPGTYASWYLLGKPYFFLSLRDVQSADIMIYPVSQTPFYQDLKFAVIRRISLEMHWPLMILGLVGMATLALRPRWLVIERPAAIAASVLALVIAYAIAFHMVVAPFPRYAIPFRPLIFVLALLPLGALWTVVRRRKLPANG